jgi:hypothetical protein
MFSERGNTKPPPGAEIDWEHPLAQGLVGAWLFHEGAGLWVNDVSGRSLPGRGVNNPTRSPSPYGSVLNLASASTQYVTMGDDTRFQLGGTGRSFSVAVRARRAAIGTFHSLMMMGPDTNNNALILGFRAANSFFMSFRGNDLDTVATYTDTDWHWWHCTYNGESNRRRIYRDGVQVASDTSATDLLGTGELLVGAYAGGLLTWNGQISDLLFWKQEQPAPVVIQHASAPYQSFLPTRLTRTRVVAAAAGGVPRQYMYYQRLRAA